MSVLIFFAATPQFANNGHLHRHCHHHSHRHHHRHHHRHPHYELLAIAGCMRKTMLPKVSDCMGKLMPMGEPMDVVMGKPMLLKSESFNGGGRHR